MSMSARYHARVWAEGKSAREIAARIDALRAEPRWIGAEFDDARVRHMLQTEIDTLSDILYAEAIEEDERRTARENGARAFVHLLMQPVDIRPETDTSDERALCGVEPMAALYWNGVESLDAEPLRGVRVCPACREIIGA